MEQDSEEHASLWQQSISDIQKRIITGIITVIPITITILILYFIIAKIYQVFAPVVNNVLLYVNVPVLRNVLPVLLSVLLAGSLLYLIGLLSATFAIRRLIMIGENILARIPIIKIFYLTSKQIMDTITLPHKAALKKIVAIEYPRKGIYGLAFLTGETRDVKTGKVLVTLFLPTTPNPTSGFLLLLPEDEVYEINLTIDEGVKFIISAGIISPEKFDMRPYRSNLTAVKESHDKGDTHEIGS